jgi:hypothetical protein
VTRRDYVLIADAMRQARPPRPIALGDGIDPGWATWLSACCCLSFKLMVSNPRFDSQRFLDACGINAEAE